MKLKLMSHLILLSLLYFVMPVIHTPSLGFSCWRDAESDGRKKRGEERKLGEMDGGLFSTPRLILT